jgi:hypothetical protein
MKTKKTKDNIIEADFAWTIEMVLVAYKVGKLTLDDCVRAIKSMFK